MLPPLYVPLQLFEWDSGIEKTGYIVYPAQLAGGGTSYGDIDLAGAFLRSTIDDNGLIHRHTCSVFGDDSGMSSPTLLTLRLAPWVGFAASIETEKRDRIRHVQYQSFFFFSTEADRDLFITVWRMGMP